MPILRAEIKSFVQTWNIHYIRKQSRRPSIVYGKPYMNHYHSEVQNQGISVDNETLEALLHDVQDWDIYPSFFGFVWSSDIRL